MVTPERSPRDRGQLILVGCLTIALVVIGIGLVINTTLYTESASPALSNVQIDTASTFHLETKRGTRSLVHRINHGDPVRNLPALQDQVTMAIGNYSSLVAISYARSEPGAVNITYNPGDSKIGTRVIQREDGGFDDRIVSGIQAGQRMDWLAINVNVSATNDQEINPYHMRIANGSGFVDWQLYRNETGAGTNLTVETTLDDGSGQTTRVAHCNPVRNRVLVDGVSGELVADSCVGDTPMFGLADLEPTYDVTQIRRPNKFAGKWELVTNETPTAATTSAIDDCDASPAPAGDEACATPVVWTANVTAAYQGQDASYVRDRNVSVYGVDQ